MKRKNSNAMPVPPVDGCNLGPSATSVPPEGKPNHGPNAMPVPPVAGWGCFGAMPAPQGSGCNPDFNATPAPPEDKRNLEQILGRSAIGVVASVLVFAGLALFGANIIPQLPDTLKVALMFAVSGGLTITGSLLAVFKRNNFTLALMGCGMGSLFISVLAMHVHFGFIGEVPAYGLILAWMVACLALMRKTDSLLIAIVLQLGLACSVSLGYGSSLEGGKLALVVGYQVAASAVVVGGNLLFCRKLYRTSLFLALCLGVAASLRMWSYFGFDLRVWAQTYSLVWVCVSFVVQFATAGALCALLVASIGREWHTQVPVRKQVACASDMPGGESQAKPVAFPMKPRFQMVAVAMLAVLATRLDVYNVVERCLRAGVFGSPRAFEMGYLCSTVVATGVMVAVLALMMAAIVMSVRRRAAASGEHPLSAMLAGEIRTEVGFCLAKPALWTLLAGIACALAYLAPVSGHVTDALPLPWMWLAALCALALWKTTRGDAFRVGCLVLFCIDACFLATSGFPQLADRFDGLSAGVIGAVYVLDLCVAAGAVVRSMKPDSAGIVSFAVACTCLLMSYLYFCTPLAGESYQWSLCCMACALACVICGFVMRVGGLRLYGLVLALVCVGKLALLDLAGLDPLVRVLALVAGGVICFVISGLYNFVAKRLTKA